VNRGDIVRLKLRKGVGHEQQGARYGVVIQSDALPVRSTLLIAPTSLSALPASFRPQIVVRGKTTRLMLEQLSAVNVTRVGAQVGHLAVEEGWSVDEALDLVLGLR
jgi:mRNA interferase MazF